MPHKSQVKELTGTYNFLTVKRFSGLNKHRMAMWVCECVCGKEVTVNRGAIISGNTKSCGCKRDEMRTTHGHKKNSNGKNRATRTYSCWCEMKARCRNPNHPWYPDYGGRGITVCERWMKFENFLEDMGVAPDDMSIDRRDNNKGYCKENCHWITMDAQQRNRRNNVLIEIDGVTHCAAEWCRIAGLNRHLVATRYRKGIRGSDLLKPA